MKEWLENDRKLFDELQARIGHDKAVVISELANLCNIMLVIPPLRQPVKDLLSHLPSILGLTQQELLDVLSVMMHGRRVTPTPCSHETNPNLN